ncbi:STM3941 family protein [Flectobacillus sp. BAB-3569]|uniref:STM3941 family protein n=1 Tax=Flectobacillus sp. BAB-3569 TaxID=1509483 RepID=UPI000BA32AD7|nr:STM3941 family protein [Flectobacillus sp. BAB-3569]PAC29212.1 hypothetical protein BWI92_16420 [Flectobacillus sp. BAB-3569]
MATINFHSQFNKTIAPFTISFVFVLLCTWGLTHKQLDITEFCIFFVGILFFGAGVLQGVVKLFSDKTQVSISEEGICDYRWSRNSLIRWDDIRLSENISIFKQQFIRIKLREPLTVKKHSFLSYFGKNEISEMYIFTSDLSIDGTQLNHFINNMVCGDTPEKIALIKKLRIIE